MKTVLEHAASTLPSDTVQDALPVLSDEPTPAGLPTGLFCPNFAELPTAQFQRAEHWLQDMARGLSNADVGAFNDAKLQLLAWLKKYGTPITQWNPLVLELADVNALQGAKLPGLNLSMTCLRGCGSARVSLTGANLKGSNLLCSDLSQVDLPHVDLSGSDLRYADLRDANLMGATLVQTAMDHAKLSYANLDGANLYASKLTAVLGKQVSMIGANLRKVDLRNADLYQAVLRHAYLQQADLRDSNLFMVDFSEARLRRSDLRNTNLGFAQLVGARMPDARLSGSDVTSADLTMADLRRVRCDGALLVRAVLTQTNLNHADLSGANLSQVRALDTASLVGAALDKHTVLPASYRMSSRQKHRLFGLNRFKRLLSWLMHGKLPWSRRMAQTMMFWML